MTENTQEPCPKPQPQETPSPNPFPADHLHLAARLLILGATRAIAHNSSVVALKTPQ